MSPGTIVCFGYLVRLKEHFYLLLVRFFHKKNQPSNPGNKKHLIWLFREYFPSKENSHPFQAEKAFDLVFIEYFLSKENSHPFQAQKRQIGNSDQIFLQEKTNIDSRYKCLLWLFSQATKAFQFVIG